MQGSPGCGRYARPVLLSSTRRDAKPSSIPHAPIEAAPTAAGDVVIIGAGPAGLTAAYQLGKAGVASTVLEADDVVGGISRTVERDGWRFDIGGHRFFTKVQAVEDLWNEILAQRNSCSGPR